MVKGCIHNQLNQGLDFLRVIESTSGLYNENNCNIFEIFRDNNDINVDENGTFQGIVLTDDLKKQKSTR